MHKLKIGSLKIKNQLLLAPMVEVTDLPYRLICRKAGAAMAYTEMLYINAITHENKKTLGLMKTSRRDSPLGIQITGTDINELKKAIPYLKPYDLVDINCGCPSDRIVSSNSGSCLLQSPEKIKQMIKTLKKEDLIVTAKIRLGFKKNNVLEIAKTIEKAGADAISVHPRLATHGYNIPADHSWTRKVKSLVGIPVIANGDINSGSSAAEILDFADGAMIGRAAIGDPIIFERILYYLKTGNEPEFNYKKNIKCFQDYLKLAKKYKLVDIPRIKYLGTKFIRNIEGSAKLRNQFMQLKTFDEIREFVNSI